MKKRFLLTLLVGLLPSLAMAQVATPVEPYGNLRSARPIALTDPGVIKITDDDGPNIIWLGGPLAVRSGASRALGVFGGLFHQFRYSPKAKEVSHVLVAAGVRIEPDEASDHLNLLSLSDTLGLWVSQNDRTSISLVTGYSDLEDAAEGVSAGFAIDHMFSGTPDWTFTLNLGWERSDPDTGDSIEDETGGLGFKRDLGNGATVSVDWVVENDLVGEESFSISLAANHGSSGKLTAAVAKHGTARISYRWVF